MSTANAIPSTSEGQEEIEATDQTMPIEYDYPSDMKANFCEILFLRSDRNAEAETPGSRPGKRHLRGAM